MKLLKTLIRAAAALALVCPMTHSYTNPIVIKGYKMYDARTGEYFTVRGVDYYPRANAGELNINNYDYFTDEHEDIWSQDIEHFKALGVNAIRLYAVDPSKSHDKFMCALRANGMYALIDMGASCRGCHITTDAAPKCYSSDMRTRGQLIIKAFHKYDNVLAFSAGNEINNEAVIKNFENAPCQKRFIRDLRKYIHDCGLRKIPVGVVLSDRDRLPNAKYYNCQTDPNDAFETAEFYGLNVYLYCNHKIKTAKDAAGFQQLLSDFKSINPAVPVLLTEYGCLNPSFPTVDGYDAQRTWLQTGWLHSKDFREIFNGGFVFEYSTENANAKADSPYPFTSFGPQNYGLGYYSPATCNHASVKCTYNRMPNFDSLASQYVNNTDVSDEPTMGNFTIPSTRTQPVACPSSMGKLSDFDWSASLNVSSLECPSTSTAFVCPNQQSSGSWGSGSAKSSAGSSTGSGSKTGSSSSPGSKTNTTTPSPTPAPTSDALSASTLAASVMVVALTVFSVL